MKKRKKEVEVDGKETERKGREKVKVRRLEKAWKEMGKNRLRKGKVKRRETRGKATEREREKRKRKKVVED